jgi:arylsulfatase A-like enzyme
MEILWVQVQLLIRLVPGSLRLSTIAPADFWPLTAAAIATYLPLGALVGLMVLPLARRWLAGTTPSQALGAGAFLGAGALTSLGVVAWINLLLDLPLLSLASVTAYAAGALASGAGAACGALVLVRFSRSAGHGFLALALIAVALVMGGRWAHDRAERGPLPGPVVEKPAEGLPNVVFVTIDTLRGDHLGVYGGRFRTPVFDRLAAEGLLFSQVVSQIPHTTPSHVSIFTSVYPSDHGAINGVPMQARHTTLPSHLQRLGYHTAAFVSAFTAKSGVTGLGDSFDVYVDSMNPWLPLLSNDALEPLIFWRLVDRLSWGQIGAPVVNRRVLSWLDGEPAEPFFLWVHYFDAHAPFPPLPRYQAVLDLSTKPNLETQLRELYGLAVEYSDEQLGWLLRQLADRGVLDDAVLVVTSDHGEALGESHPSGGRPSPHGSGKVNLGHGGFLYDPVLLIPLVIWSPGRVKPATVEVLIQSIDIAPMLLELLGHKVPASFKGRSLRQILEDQRAGKESIAFSQTQGVHRESSGVLRHLWFSARTPRWKLLLDPNEGTEELFDLEADPGERVSLVEQHPEVAQGLREQLTDAMPLGALGAGVDQLDAQTLRNLRALGYLLDEESE